MRAPTFLRLRGSKALPWAVAAGVLGLLFLSARRLDWTEVASSLLMADPALALVAAAANLGALVTRALAWWLFLVPWGIRSGAGPMRATLAGAAVNNLLPWNAGDAFRVWALAIRERIAFLRVLGAAAMERVTAVAAALLLLGAAVWFVPFPGPMAEVGRAGFFGLLLAVGVYVPASRALGSARLARWCSGRLGGFWRSVGEARVTPGRLGAAVALGAAGWLLQLVTYQTAAQAVGLQAGLHGNAALLVATNLSFVVRLTPGGVGVFQAAYVATAAALGHPAQLALTAAILLQALQVVPVTLLGAPLVPAALARARGRGRRTHESDCAASDGGR